MVKSLRHSQFQVGKALRAVQALLKDPDDTAQVFRIIDALSGPTFVLNAMRMRLSQDGRGLLREKPTILSHLLATEHLTTLPEDSLGRAYLRFLEAEGITVEGLTAASMEGRELEEDALHPDVNFVRNRLRDTHDLWHTVTGYQGDIIGEAALLAYSFSQVFNLGVGLIVTAVFFRDPSFEVKREIVRGLFNGLRSRWLPAVAWEELLAMPLDDVRKQLQIPPPPKYTPYRSTEYKANDGYVVRAA